MTPARAPLWAQGAPSSTAPRPHSALRFVAGAVSSFAAHESGHLITDLAFGAHPYIHEVKFGAIPFFAVAQRDAVTPREEYVISSAGFWVQHAMSEWILTRHPDLRHESSPFRKGVLAFNLALPAGYAISSFFKAGPAERDPRSMAVSIRVDEPVIGLMILAPALLDAYRYAKSGNAWASWSSRAVKLGSIALALRARGTID